LPIATEEQYGHRKGIPKKMSGTKTSHFNRSARLSAMILGFGKLNPNASVSRITTFLDGFPSGPEEKYAPSDSDFPFGDPGKAYPEMQSLQIVAIFTLQFKIRNVATCRFFSQLTVGVIPWTKDM
jgi:hypothetical protein